ncbi:MAG: putative ATPase [Glaciecola sp.]|jgi:putative ATPase
MSDLFSAAAKNHAPLAARMRPRNLDEYVGQATAVGTSTPLRRLVEAGTPPSLILWGPPGTGKTSLAHVVAATVRADWRELSAVTAGVKDVRAVLDAARSARMSDRRTVLFLDEIHRFNKGQQDALLPGVEEGLITLIGATTENPYFELNAPLLSRCTLVRLSALDDDDVRLILSRALVDPRGLAGKVTIDDDAVGHLVSVADGDARAALTALEVAAAVAVTADGEAAGSVTLDLVSDAMTRFRYDKAADNHYDQVSAFIKSMRGSDPDASVYWLLRMLEAGEDPRFLARRMVIFASEDVGMADRMALPTAVAAFDALDKVGLPEARYALVHACLTLATAPKSNSVTRAIGAGLAAVHEHPNATVPAHLRDGHYKGAKQLGHGVGYAYPHSDPSGHVVQQYLPDDLDGTVLYEPGDLGHEGPIAERTRARRSRGHH